MRDTAFRSPVYRAVGHRGPPKKKLSRTFRTRFRNTSPFGMSFLKARSSAKLRSPRRRAENTWRQPSRRHTRSEKAGFRVARQGKHIVMTDGVRIITIPRHNPVNAFTMGGIVRDAGLSEDESRALL